MMSSPIRLTRRGRAVMNAAILTGFILVMGFVGWIETLGM